MSVPVRLAAFALAAAAAFGLGVGVGDAVGTFDDDAPAQHAPRDDVHGWHDGDEMEDGR